MLLVLPSALGVWVKMRFFTGLCGVLLVSVLSAEEIFPSVSDRVSQSESTHTGTVEHDRSKMTNAVSGVNELNTKQVFAESSVENPTKQVSSESQIVAAKSAITPPQSKVTVSEASNWPFVMLTLFAMVVCILLIAWILKRFSGITGLGGKDLRIVSAIALGARERIAIVDVKGEQFLIGVTSQNISLLHSFDDAPITTSESVKSSEFANKLQSILRQPAKPNTEES